MWTMERGMVGGGWVVQVEAGGKRGVGWFFLSFVFSSLSLLPPLPTYLAARLHLCAAAAPRMVPPASATRCRLPGWTRKQWWWRVAVAVVVAPPPPPQPPQPVWSPQQAPSPSSPSSQSPQPPPPPRSRSNPSTRRAVWRSRAPAAQCVPWPAPGIHRWLCCGGRRMVEEERDVGGGGAWTTVTQTGAARAGRASPALPACVCAGGVWRLSGMSKRETGGAQGRGVRVLRQPDPQKTVVDSLLGSHSSFFLFQPILDAWRRRQRRCCRSTALPSQLPPWPAATPVVGCPAHPAPPRVAGGQGGHRQRVEVEVKDSVG